MSKMRIVYVFSALFFTASVALTIYLSDDPRVTYYSDLIAVIVAIFPVMTFLYAYTYFEKGRIEKKIMLIFIVGLLFWLGGEILWFYYEGLMETDPFPSAADVLWICGYPFILAGLFYQYKTVRVRLEKKYEWGLAVLLSIIGVVMISMLVFVMETSEEFTDLEMAICSFYPFADILLLYFSLLLTGLYWAGKLSYAWLLIALGIFFFAAGDIWFVHLEWLEIYPDVLWHPVDFTWTLGDLLIFMGAAKYRFSFEEVVNGDKMK